MRVLTLVVVLSFMLPARLVFPPLGAAGRPALLASLGLLLLWAFGRIVGDPRTFGRQPVRVGALVFGWTLMLVYAVGLSRGMPPVELRASDRFMLLGAGLVGLVLTSADGIVTRRDLDVVLRRITYAAAAVSAIGLVEFSSGLRLVSWIRLPGLALNADLINGVQRGGFARTASTATHPIEFGVVLGMVLPVAVHYATTGDARGRRRGMAVTAVIAAGIPLPVARSALIAAAVGVFVLAAGWCWRRQLNAITLAAGASFAYALVVPGLLGTVRGLFLNASTDGSVQVRLDDYEPVLEHFGERPWFGLGPGTFLPDQYRQLDNQVLKFAVEVGVIGVLAIFGLLVLAAVLAARVASIARSAGDEETASLGRALCGAVLAGIAVSATFDSFSYQIYDTALFLFVGSAGALWRMSIGQRDAVEEANWA